MRIKDGFIMRTISDMYVVVPVEKESRDFHGMIQLNESGAFLWKQMSQEFEIEDLIQALMNEYHVSYEVAKKDINHVIESLKKSGILVD